MRVLSGAVGLYCTPRGLEVLEDFCTAPRTFGGLTELYSQRFASHIDSNRFGTLQGPSLPQHLSLILDRGSRYPSSPSLCSLRVLQRHSAAVASSVLLPSFSFHLATDAVFTCAGLFSSGGRRKAASRLEDEPCVGTDTPRAGTLDLREREIDAARVKEEPGATPSPGNYASSRDFRGTRQVGGGAERDWTSVSLLASASAPRDTRLIARIFS